MAGCCGGGCGTTGRTALYAALAAPMTIAGIEFYKSEIGSQAGYIWLGALGALALLGVGMFVVARRSAARCAPKSGASKAPLEGVDAEGRHIRGTKW